MLLMLAALQSCAAIAPRPIVPRVEIEGVRAATLVDNAITLLVGLKVTNPNAFNVAVDVVEADVRIEGLPAASGRLPSPVTLAGNGDTHVDVEARTTVDNLSRVLDTALRRGRLAYEITGYAIIQDGRRITYSKQGDVTLAELLGRRS
jgi:LEA14-like dessication related protein